MRIVAIGAIAGRARMLNFCGFNLFRLLVVAGHAQCLYVFLCKHHFSVLRGRVAHVTALVRKWRVRERLHQFRIRRLVRIMAGQAVRSSERLVLVCLLQVGVFWIVTLDAQSRRRLGQMKAILEARLSSGFVRRVAGIATHVERGVTAALGRDVRALLVAGEAQIFFFAAQVAFSSWFLFPLVCGSWHFRQSRTAGL